MSCHSSPSPRVLAMKRDAADSVVNGMKDKEQLDSLVEEAEKSGFENLPDATTLFD